MRVVDVEYFPIRGYIDKASYERLANASVTRELAALKGFNLAIQCTHEIDRFLHPDVRRTSPEWVFIEHEDIWRAGCIADFQARVAFAYVTDGEGRGFRLKWSQ